MVFVVYEDDMQCFESDNFVYALHEFVSIINKYNKFLKKNNIECDAMSYNVYMQEEQKIPKKIYPIVTNKYFVENNTFKKQSSMSLEDYDPMAVLNKFNMHETSNATMESFTNNATMSVDALTKTIEEYEKKKCQLELNISKTLHDNEQFCRDIKNQYCEMNYAKTQEMLNNKRVIEQKNIYTSDKESFFKMLNDNVDNVPDFFYSKYCVLKYMNDKKLFTDILDSEFKIFTALLHTYTNFNQNSNDDNISVESGLIDTCEKYLQFLENSDNNIKITKTSGNLISYLNEGTISDDETDSDDEI